MKKDRAWRSLRFLVALFLFYPAGEIQMHGGGIGGPIECRSERPDADDLGATFKRVELRGVEPPGIRRRS